jgi:hypothetical protein
MLTAITLLSYLRRDALCAIRDDLLDDDENDPTFAPIIEWIEQRIAALSE